MSLSSVEDSHEYRERGDKRRDAAALLTDMAYKSKYKIKVI